MPAVKKDIKYYSALPLEKLLAELHTSPQGLSSRVIAERRLRFGCNKMTVKNKFSRWRGFFSRFKSPLVIILLLSAGVSAFLGEVVNSVIIATMILVGVILDFYLEYHANVAVAKLRAMVKSQADVWRDGEKKEIDIDQVCVGDVVALNAGDLIPADARLITAKDFYVNQSALTGESLPIEKNIADPENNMVFFGTNVVSGSAQAVVFKVGVETSFGAIATKLESAPIETDFDRGIKSFGYLIMKVTMFLVLFIFLANAVLKHNYLEAFMFAIAVAVGLTPELLPMVMSVTMAKGSLKMAQKGVIVKRLGSIPNFGSMDVLCTDKTGTLTEDKIHLVKYVDVFGGHSERVLLNAYLNSFFQTGIANPLDNAILNYKKMPVGNYHKIDEIPFDFARKKMSVVVETGGKRFLVSKGAPEEVFKICKYFGREGEPHEFDKAARQKVLELYQSLSSQGYRVLALAMGEVDADKKVYEKEDEVDLELIGYVAFLDPPKKDVKRVLSELENAGIAIKIITGDNELVTKKICEEIGLEIKGILLGQEIDGLTDDALRVRAENTTIFARFSPDEKNRVINALKAGGHVVGYMGDGINDAPSLKASDISISVNSAVDVAKETADIILTHKSLEVLRDGVLEGRKTFGNTIKYIMMGLSSNFGNMFSVAGATVFLPFLPMLPIQILLNNFIYDLGQITIPTDNVDKEFVQKPKRWNLKFIRQFMLVFGPISSLFDFITFFMLLYFFHDQPAYFQTGWFMESLATQALVVHVIRTRKIPFFQSRPSRYLIISTFGCVALGWLITCLPIGRYFGFVRLPWFIWLIIAGLVLVYLLLVQLVKVWFYRRHKI
jgi:Mg2+-importing ATPase